MAVSAAGMHMKSTIQLPSTFYAMTDPNGAAIYGVPWIPSIYPSHVSIYIYIPAPWSIWVIAGYKNNITG